MGGERELVVFEYVVAVRSCSGIATFALAVRVGNNKEAYIIYVSHKPCRHCPLYPFG